MATRTVTYQQLQHALERLGFTETFRSGNHVTFTHAASGAIIVLPGSQAGEEARPIYLLTARRTVVENGLADEETFEDLVGLPCKQE